MSTQQQNESEVDPQAEQYDKTMLPTEAKTQGLITQVLGSVGTAALHNFPGSKMDQWKMIALCEGGEIADRESLGNEPFPVKFFYAHQVVVSGSTPGEYLDAVRVVLVSPGLEMIQFTSDGIGRSLAKIIQTFGMGPYDPPILVKIATIKTRRGFKTYSIIPAGL